MEQIIAGQVGVMFLLIGLGLICAKTGVLTEAAARVFVNFLLLAVTPAIIVKQFLRPADSSLLILMGFSLALVTAFQLLSVTLSRFAIPARPGTHYSSERIAAGYSNAAFMGLPLLEAALGDEALIFGVIFVVIFTIFSWTHCVGELSGSRAVSPKKLLLNPAILSIGVGLLLFLLQIPLPSLVDRAVTYTASLNTPLSMVVIGVFLAGLKPREVFRDLHMLWAVLLRNLALPLLFVVLLWAVGAPGWLPGGQAPVMAAVISGACPTAVVVILMSARTGRCDPRYGASMVALSTLLSIVTLPLVIGAANALL